MNLIVPASVYEQQRSVVRAAPLLHARGRLERREAVINIVVAKLGALDWREPEPVEAQPQQHSAAGRPRPRPRADELAQRRRARQHAVAELRAVAPAGHSFGRR